MTANQINWFNANEQKRHNLATEGVSLGTLKENKRHNVATEGLTHETNLIQDWFNRQNAMHLHNADAINAAHFERMDYETNRHNQAVEGETNRHNVYQEYTDRFKAARQLAQTDRELGLREREVSVKEQTVPIQEQQAGASVLNAFSNLGKVDVERDVGKAKITESASSVNLKEQQAKYYQAKPYLEAADIIIDHFDSRSKSFGNNATSMMNSIINSVTKLIPLFID